MSASRYYPKLKETTIFWGGWGTRNSVKRFDVFAVVKI
jgi:hypothetical protein